MNLVHGAAAWFNLALALIELGRIEDAAEAGAEALAVVIDASDPTLAPNCLEVVAGAETTPGEPRLRRRAARSIRSPSRTDRPSSWNLSSARCTTEHGKFSLRHALSEAELEAGRTEGADMDLMAAFSDADR